jgi:hypothetical protein
VGWSCSGHHGMLWSAAYDAHASASSAFSMARSASTSASDARRARAQLTDKVDAIQRAIAIAGSGSNWPGGAPCGVGDPENWLGLIKPDGRDGLVRVPGGKAANWSSGGMMWTAECRRHVWLGVYGNCSACARLVRLSLFELWQVWNRYGIGS